MGPLQGKQVGYFNSCLSSHLESTLKGKNLLLVSKFFPFKVDYNLEGLHCLGKQIDSCGSCLPLKNCWGKYSRVLIPLNFLRMLLSEIEEQEISARDKTG